MKLLIVDTYYPEFLHTFYAHEPDLQYRTYAEQWQRLMGQYFGTADFYSINLKNLGYEAHEVVPNCSILQRRWAREHARHLWAAYPLYFRLGRVKTWQMAVLTAQVDKFKPDILYVHDLNWVESDVLKLSTKKGRLIVGQIGYAVGEHVDLRLYHLIVSSFPHYVERFRRQGIKSEYLRLAFDPRVLPLLDPARTKRGVLFIGSYSASHSAGNQLLEFVARRVSVDFWGYGIEALHPTSPIRRSFRGEAWGLQMYRHLGQSAIALNRHGDIAEHFANNMRLFEATGVGTLLLTDWKDNLPEMFEVEKELIAYRTAEECVELISYYLEHDDERQAVATAGQQRTLREHTYQRRMEELVDIVRKHL